MCGVALMQCIATGGILADKILIPEQLKFLECIPGKGDMPPDYMSAECQLGLHIFHCYTVLDHVQ